MCADALDGMQSALAKSKLKELFSTVAAGAPRADGASTSAGGGAAAFAAANAAPASTVGSSRSSAQAPVVDLGVLGRHKVRMYTVTVYTM